VEWFSDIYFSYGQSVLMPALSSPD